MSRTRMTPEARRAQLLEVGSEVFGTRPFDEVWIEEVAARAGVSRGLLYHYFPSKRDFFQAVVEAHADELLRCTLPDPALEPAQRLRASLEGYVSYVRANPHGYRALYRGAPAAETSVRNFMERNMDIQAERILADLPPALRGRHTALAIRGWLGFITSSCLAWLDDQQLSADELIDLWGRALGGALLLPAAPDA